MITLHSPSVRLLSMHVPVGFVRLPWIYPCRCWLPVRRLAATSPLSGSRRPPSTPRAERTCCSLFSAYRANVRFWPGTNHWHELKTAARQRPKRNANGHRDQQTRCRGAIETPRRPQEFRARRCSRITITSVVCRQKCCRIS